jgi:hypothetical protein
MVVAGSRFRVGLNLSWRNSASFPSSPDYFPSWIQDEIEGCLYQSGNFFEVHAERQGGFFNPYVVISGVTAIDFGQADDIGGNIAQTLSECAVSITLDARDNTVIDAVPASYVGAAGVQQVNATDQGGARIDRIGDEPGKCDAAWQKGVTDYLACQLGVTPQQGVLIGALGALLVVVLVSKLAR